MKIIIDKTSVFIRTFTCLLQQIYSLANCTVHFIMITGYLKIAECADMYCRTLFFSCIGDMYAKYISTHKVITIISRYLEAIENSTELSDEDKECIKYGMATALYSFNYWNVFYN